MEDFEKLGVFYLGRPYDLARKTPKPGWLLYDSKDLVTHAVCVGMTGSGKTGLCIGLLEEAAIDGIPALVIDPKGDLTNLLLTFPSLRAEDFLPWINEDDARKQGLSPTDYARQQAARWSKGLADWGQDGGRIRRLRDAAEFTIYTPGSDAGLPASILTSFAAPSEHILAEPELLRERISIAVTGLLGLVGIDADPLQSREHILLSTILHTAWRAGQDLDLSALIRHIQTPDIEKVGVLDLESFYPAKERFQLAMKLNNLLAAPGFATWLQGQTLDIARILHTPAGKPRIAIFSIAHLNDAERMFFVTLLLGQIVAWMRLQSGTTSLRAVLYMDEIFGYFPPVANPPSKEPLLTLLKQARAYGLGVVLATQNPVDLDYKGLSNTGTWFIGRLQTERDKARVLDGLEGVAAGQGAMFDRRRMEQLLAGLGSRIFLLNNVHEDAPEIFESRWTLSYLRGPLTRAQIKQLMDPYKTREALGVRSEEKKQDVSTLEGLPSPLTPHTSRPVLPPEVPQYFVPMRGPRPAGNTLVYRPTVLGAAHIRFLDSKMDVDLGRDQIWLAPVTDEPVPVNWEEAEAGPLAIGDLRNAPEDSTARYASLPASAGKPKNYDLWEKDFAGWLFRTQKLELYRSPGTKQVSRPDESEGDFRVRLAEAGREMRDQAADQLRKKYAPKLAALDQRIRRAEQTKAKQVEQARTHHVQTAISIGATVLGAFLGRKIIGATTIEKVATAARKTGRSIQEAKDVGFAEENVEALRKQLTDLEAEFKAEMDVLLSKSHPAAEILDMLTLRPHKSNIGVKLVALAWMPHWYDAQGTFTPAWQ
jgi:hypothetical protein